MDEQTRDVFVFSTVFSTRETNRITNISNLFVTGEDEQTLFIFSIGEDKWRSLFVFSVSPPEIRTRGERNGGTTSSRCTASFLLPSSPIACETFSGEIYEICEASFVNSSKREICETTTPEMTYTTNTRFSILLGHLCGRIDPVGCWPEKVGGDGDLSWQPERSKDIFMRLVDEGSVAAHINVCEAGV
nr:hypothetical protein Iba_chr15aCG8910 [Ipomoea batatas]